MSDIIFITNDNKSDWWQKVHKKTIGPLPELIDEIKRESKIKKFHMYTMDSFLNYAKQHLDTNLDDNAIEEIREISNRYQYKTENEEIHGVRSRSYMFAQEGVYKWLRNKFNNVKIHHRNLPDLTVHQNGLKYAFEIKLINDTCDLHHRLSSTITQFFKQYRRGEFSEISIIIVVPHQLIEIEDISYRLNRELRRYIPFPRSIIKLIIGSVEIKEDGCIFIPQKEIKLPNFNSY